uniref:Secreted protein n=1 Tax=Panagrellus redivivus TaxID=6233 RepID=A0A7E4V1R3_PANRE
MLIQSSCQWPSSSCFEMAVCSLRPVFVNGRSCFTMALPDGRLPVRLGLIPVSGSDLPWHMPTVHPFASPCCLLVLFGQIQRPMPVRVLHMPNTLTKLPIFSTRFCCRCCRHFETTLLAAFLNCRCRDLAAISSMMVHSPALKF